MFVFCSAISLGAAVCQAQETISSNAPEPGASGSGAPASAQDTTTTSSTSNTAERILVRGEEVPSAYGAPPAFSRNRFSPLTDAYVLPPGGFFLGALYEGDFRRHDSPAHIFTQEVEVGLPYRFGVALENRLVRSDGEGQDSTISLETRHALADWNKIPLNPTIFAEYKLGIGHAIEEEMMDERDMGGESLRRLQRLRRGQEDEPGDEDGEGPPKQPDAVEFRLLLSQDFGEKVEWAANFFIEQETSGDRGREMGLCSECGGASRS